MNGPNFGVANAFHTDGEAQQMQQELEHTEGIVASLDAEIASAMAAREKLIQRRNEIQQIIVSHEAPEASAIQAFISEEELKLNRLRRDIIDAENHLDDPIIKNLAFSSDTEVDRRRSTLEQLVHDRDETKLILEKHRTSLSPIRRLPPEVLGEIFLRCISTDFCQPKLSEAPLLLMNVCSVWRSVALHTPDIWASISVIYRGPVVWPNEELIKLWLERSGSRPLSFSMIAEGRGVRDRSTAGPLLLDTFLVHGTRWRTIKFEFEPYSMETGFDKIPENAMFPLLESIYFEIRPWFNSESIARLNVVIRAAPHLCSVAWINLSDHHRVGLPWEQLTSLDLMGSKFTPDDCLHVIQTCQNLKAGKFSVVLPPGYPSKSTRFTHHCLAALSLNIEAISHLECFFDGITLPHLHELSIETDAFGATGPLMVWPHSHFTDMLDRSSSSLRNLTISGIGISSEDLVEVLWRVSSSLETLTLSAESPEKGCIDDVVLSSLTLPPSLEETEELPPLCPNLTQCNLWGSVSSSDGVLADMIESRWTPRGMKYPVAQLEVMMVMLHAAHHPKDTARLGALDEQTRIRVILI